jgi:hypothetical protein
VVFVKVTRTISGWDVVEEYMSCTLFPLSANFNLGEIAKGETLVSKLSVPLSEFPVARHPEETNDGQVNIVFEQASVPYGPRLEPGSEACEEAAKRRKSDTSFRPSRKHAKVSGQKMMPMKVSVAPKGASANPSKTVLAKATHTTQA